MNAFRNDSYAKVTGRATYADDISYSGMLHAVPVYCDYVVAEDLSIDYSKALEVPGVVRVITAKDVPGSTCFGQIKKDYPILVSNRISSWGDVIAIVVASDRTIAKKAASLVEVKATEKKPVFSINEALETNAPIVPADGKNNIVSVHRLRHGDPDPLFSDCELILDEDFSTQRVEHAYIEPEAVVCVPRSDGVIEIFSCTQVPFSTRRFVAAFLGESLANIEIVSIPIGGSFGGKDDTIGAICARAALAARLTHKPVKIKYEREWSMRESYKRHPYQMHYKVGVSSEGRILAVKATIYAESGAYLSTTPWSTWRSTAQAFGPYSIDNIHADVYGVATNNIFNGAMRGFGAPQINFAVEQIMDIISHKLKIHPLGLRRINMVKQESQTITGQILTHHKVSIEDVMNRAVHEIGFRKKYEHCSYGKSDTDDLYGIGLAISYRGSSLGAEGMDFCSCIINGQFDGSILLETGIHEMGQGSESVMIITLAEELGVNLKRIRYHRSSTSSIPDSGTTVATRGTIMGSSSVVVAANNFKALVAEHLAPRLRCEPNEVTFHDDKIWGLKFEFSLSWEDAMKELYLLQVAPFAFGLFRAPDVTWNDTTGQGNAYFTYVYSCQAVEVNVNKKTGIVKVTNVVAVHDIGKAINPPLVEGQIYGGVAMALGYSLFEDFPIVNGKTDCLNFNKYKIPRTTDMPPIQAVIIENKDPASLTGAKGIGEPATELLAPAIANAVYNATGIRCRDLPIRIDPKELEKNL